MPYITVLQPISTTVSASGINEYVKNVRRGDGRVARKSVAKWTAPSIVLKPDLNYHRGRVFEELDREQTNVSVFVETSY